MNRTIKSRLEKIEKAVQPRYPEIPTIPPEERVLSRKSKGF